MTNDLPILFDRIRELTDEQSASGPRPPLEEIERTLTDGYANALQLEGERWRIEKRISELVGLIQADPQRAQELGKLAERLSSADGDLRHLRGLLGALRDRAEAVRGDDRDQPAR